MNLSIIVPTCGRTSLVRTLDSIVAAGLLPTDEVIVVGDGPRPSAEELVKNFRKDYPGFQVRYFEHGPTFCFGNAQRQFGIGEATGTHLLFIDDDDAYVLGAIDEIRKHIQENPDRVLIFRVESHTPRHTWGYIWKIQRLVMGNVSTQTVVVPNVSGRIGRWTEKYYGDFDFIRSTVDLHPDRDAGVVWIDKVVAYLY